MLLVSGCARTEVRATPVPLPLPARPVLQPVHAEALACLSDDAYTTIVNRERAYRTWALQLEAIIAQNNAHAAGGKP